MSLVLTLMHTFHITKIKFTNQKVLPNHDVLNDITNHLKYVKYQKPSFNVSKYF
jgi:hypothetical protein